MKNIKLITVIICGFFYFSCAQRDTTKEENKVPAVDVSVSYEKGDAKNVNFDENEYVSLVEWDAPVIQDSILRQNGFLQFANRYKKVNLEEALYYVVEGDLLLDMDQLYHYYEETILLKDSITVGGSRNDKLLGIVREGTPVLAATPNNITYSIIKSSFSNEKNYHNMVDYMKTATGDWSEHSNINFIHVKEFDAKLRPSDNPKELSFVVREYPAGGDFIAKAFFPYYPKFRKKIYVDPSFYTMRFDPAGVMRHELGHTLGFLHEHIRSGAPAVCPNESLAQAVELTAYDPKSVMHYFCGGVGTVNLELSENDKIGVRILYGPKEQ
jgi:hypothetical protein